MRTKYYIPALLTSMLLTASCNDNDLNSGNNKPANPQDGINFTIGQESANSRTQYAPNDWLQIEWIDGDKTGKGKAADRITIFCDKTVAPTGENGTWEPNKSAVYKVKRASLAENTVYLSDGTTKTIETYSQATIEIDGGQTPLYWGSGQHTFYAGYGQDIIIDPTTGTAKCKYQTEQTLSEVNGTWINMSQAYMVATATSTPEENKTNLLFKPIMTTLEVELKGMTGEDANAKSITVKSMEVTIDREADVLYSVGNDKYFDIKINSSDGSINSIDTTPTKKSERTFTFTLKEPQTVEKGGSISITAILPGIDIGGTNGKPVTITINTADGSNISTFSGQVKSGYKAKIVTEPWAKPEKYVDLGLSVKWATCNLGASKPEEYGDYYGWGCVKPYEQGENVGDALYFSKLGYAGGGTNTYGTENDPLKDYVISSIGNIAGSNWDAARAKLSDKWRMPTKTEFAELLDKTKCTWEWITNYNGTGRNGYLVTSNVPGYKGNSIFLPAAGYRTGTSFKYNNLGYYWSSNPSNSTIAHILLLGTSADLPKIDGSNRRFGFSIRPVWDSSTDEIKEVDLGLPSGTKWASRCLGPSDESSSISGSGKYSYFGWGCTKSYPTKFSNWTTYFLTLGPKEPKSSYSYSDCGTSYDPLQYYVNNCKSIAGTQCDAAYVTLGDKWRMPTDTEWQELINKCSWIWYDNYNGEKGYAVIGSNGNFIFLPAGGLNTGSGPSYVGTVGYYWSAMPAPLDPNNLLASYSSATIFSFNSEERMCGVDLNSSRCYGFLIYPVAAK